jgi:hypothetical protein
MRLNKRYFLLKKLIGILILLINTTFGQNAKNAERLAYCDSLEKVALAQGKPALTAKAYYIRGKIASEQFDINRSNEWFFKALEIHKNLAISEDLGKVYLQKYWELASPYWDAFDGVE